jgi:hypothetical protein
MVSLKQVAALAGVSSSTVSRAVVAPERLHPKTLEKVREAIASLDYVPFAPARVLRSGRSRTIGIVAPTLMNELYARAVDTLEKEFLQFGYTGLLTCHRDMFYNPVTAKPFEWEFHRGRKVTEIPAEGRLLVVGCGGHARRVYRRRWHRPGNGDWRRADDARRPARGYLPGLVRRTISAVCALSIPPPSSGESRGVR